MKKLICLALLFLLILPSSVQAMRRLKSPPVVEITRSGRLFTKPSSKAKVLADVDSGTLVLGRALSVRGGWMLIEDEGGSQGWYPAKWTNWDEIMGGPKSLKEPPNPIQSLIRKEDRYAKQLPANTEKEKPKDTGPSFLNGFEMGINGQYYFTADKPGVFELELNYLEKNKKEAMGASLQWGLSKNIIGFSVVRRFMWGGGLFRELDFGYKKRSNLGEATHSSSLGYALGFYVGSSIILSLRGGLIGFSDSQWTLGGRVLWAF